MSPLSYEGICSKEMTYWGNITKGTKVQNEEFKARTKCAL